jgi:hypothetical protein
MVSVFSSQVGTFSYLSFKSKSGSLEEEKYRQQVDLGPALTGFVDCD